MNEKPSAQDEGTEVLHRSWVADDLLNDPSVQKIIKENSSRKGQIENAATILSEDNELKEFEDAVAALKHAAGGIVQDYIDVFFSYKSQDLDTASTIVSELRTYAAKKLKITFAGDFPEDIPGAKWDRMIREGIKKSHWFILLLPDPSVDWDWCLYETGQFRNRMLSDKVHKLICLHHPKQKKLPRQIENFQMVKADKESLMGLLRMVYIKDNPIAGMKAINPDVENKLQTICNTIIEAVKPRSQNTVHDRMDKYVSLRIQNPTELGSWEKLNSAEIKDVGRETLPIFGKISKPETWELLIDNIITESSDKRWVKGLCASIQEAAKGNAFGPIQATFKGQNSGKLFRPHLHALDRYNGRIELFTVLFLEEVGEGLTDHISEKVRVLITFFRMTTRFRLEVIQRYKSEIEPDQVKELEDIINRMETEAQSRGDHNMDVLLECFKNNKNATNVITNMAQKWSSYRNVDRTGKLDIAIKQKNVDEIKRILDDLSIMNREFLEIVLTEMGKALMEI